MPSERKKILKAALHNNLSVIKAFKETNPDTHWNEIRLPKTGATCLHLAAQEGHLKIIKYLLTSYLPKDVDSGNNDSKTALHEAAQFSQHEVVAYLIENGAQVDALKRADWTPLMLACTRGGPNAFKTVEILVRNGANVEYKNKDGWTPFLLAVRIGDLDIIKYLLNVNGNQAMIPSKTKRTPLHIACLHGHSHVAKVLLELPSIDIEAKDNCGNTSFHDAVISGDLDLIELFAVRHGADVLVTNNIGLNCLHMAAYAGSCRVLTYLIKELHFPPNCISADDNRVTPLHCAGRSKNTEAFDLLITLGCNPNIKDAHGRLPSYYLNS